MIIQSFSSKHRHVTEKHDLIGPPLIYFPYWLRSRHRNHLISEILEQTNTWFEVSATFSVLTRPRPCGIPAKKI